MGLATYSASVSFGLSLPPSGLGDCTEGMGEGVWCYPSYREQRPIPQSTKAESPHHRYFAKLNGTYSKLCRLQDAVQEKNYKKTCCYSVGAISNR